MQDMELIIFEIISNGGNAKALVYEAMGRNLKKVILKRLKELLEEADHILNKAHQVQNRLNSKRSCRVKEMKLLYFCTCSRSPDDFDRK